MKLEIKFGSPKPYDYDTLLDQFSGTKINSIRTSSVPLLEFWKDTEKKLELLFKEIGINGDNPLLCFEYPTKPQKGKGKSSMTDLMIINGKAKIAIEAKFTEYCKMKSDLIEKWKKEGNTENRELVLGYWTSLIEKFSNGINLESLNEIDYQFYHRTASACSETKSAIVIYQLFYDNKTKGELDVYKNKLYKYVRLINPKESLNFYIWEVEVKQQVLKLSKPQNNPFIEMKNQKIYDISNSKISKIDFSK